MNEQSTPIQSRSKYQHAFPINNLPAPVQSARNDSIIFHVDMDHFFTAIEAREQTQYREEALIVGADPKKGRGRGVVSTCNYHARKYGIASGMPISQAWRLCPTAIF